MSKAHGITILLGLVGLLLSWWGFADRELRERLAANGKTAAGTVEHGEVRKGRRSSRSHWLTVQYTPADGAPILGEFEVREGFYREKVDGGRIVDRRCDVLYDPASPADAIVGGTQDRSAFLPVGTGLVVVGAIGFWWVSRRAATAAQADRT